MRPQSHDDPAGADIRRQWTASGRGTIAWPRLGQYRPIKVVRIIIENSIESRILQLQEKKNLLFQSTVGMDASALSRLTEEDLRFLFIL